METKKLYVDGLNIASMLGFGSKIWNLEEPKKGVKRFVDACKKSGFEIKVFIDAGIESEEAQKKWKDRREKEVIEERKGVIMCMSTILGDLFKSHGIQVLYSPSTADCDDCIAYFANRDEADILSSDADFLRYTGAKYTVFDGSFKYSDDDMLILFKKKPPRREITPKELLKEEPKMYENDPVMINVKETNTIRRGCPSSLVKILGNNHDYLGAFRSALYYKKGVKGIVRETYPVWKDDKVQWKEVDVESSSENLNLYDSKPSRFYDLFEFSQRMTTVKEEIEEYELLNHWLSLALCICELHASFYDKPILEIFESDELFVKLAQKSYEAYLKDPSKLPSGVCCRNWKEDGACKFGDRCNFKESHFICKCQRGDRCIYKH